jgi:hypothetical protein
MHSFSKGTEVKREGRKRNMPVSITINCFSSFSFPCVCFSQSCKGSLLLRPTSLSHDLNFSPTTGHVDKAAIFNTEGTSCWATSKDFQVRRIVDSSDRGLANISHRAGSSACSVRTHRPDLAILHSSCKSTQRYPTDQPSGIHSYHPKNSKK